jgi:tRNA threonylcarbamoyl adenosine modification protein (Sua5/YciO/YrdC/YwlC family)
VDDVRHAIAAVRAGDAVLLPTDTVYGLCTTAERDEPAWRLYRLKERDQAQPMALVASKIEVLVECVPELRGRAELIVRALLPGPFTLVLPNPARRFRWLTGARSDTIGVRVPDLPAPAERVLDAVGCIAATSANERGGPDPATLDEVPARIRSACAAEIDAGRLPGIPSTVIDFTGAEPVVIREGAAPAAEAIDRVREVLPA